MVLNIIAKNTDYVKNALSYLVENPPQDNRSCDCLSALATAMITDPEVIPSQTRDKLALLVNKYLEE
jgi:5'-methylthioadenosine phosphorylase